MREDCYNFAMGKTLFCLAVAGLGLISPLRAQTAPERQAPTERKQETVEVKTSDGWTLYADYLAPEKDAPTVILFHGLGSSRGEWSVLEATIAAKGGGYLAVDMRCHGESTKNPGGSQVPGWQSCQVSDDDVAGAWAYLLEAKALPEKIFIAGASVGSSLALNAAAERKAAPAGVILLSPGLDFRGIKTDESVAKLGKARLLMGAAKADQYSFDSMAALDKLAAKAGKKAVTVTAAAGHGVSMFSNDNPDAGKVVSAIADFVFPKVKQTPAPKKPAAAKQAAPVKKIEKAGTAKTGSKK